MSSSCPSQNAAATTNGQRATAVGVLPVNVQNAQNSPELANMTVGQLLGQAQRRVSVTHVNSAAKLSASGLSAQRNQGRVNSTQTLSLTHPMSAGGTTMSQAQQQLATTSTEQTQINRPVFHSYRFEDGRVSMPTRKLISTIDQQETYYKIDPDQPNKVTPMDAEVVRNEQKMAHAVATADQVWQVAFPHAQSASSETIVNDSQARTDQAELAMDAGRGTLINRARLNDLVEQLDPSTVLEEDVKDALLEMVDDFVEQVLDRSCKLCRHRGSSHLDAKDVSFVLERYYNMPRMIRGETTTVQLKTEGDAQNMGDVSREDDMAAHNQRIALIKKTLKKP
uniref:Transcription initiation factor TFIID subunit 12 n=1 Tax=Ascaris suum TaxID=6253 RepID=F1KV15_ASCSU